jgi:hypothetical protein
MELRLTVTATDGRLTGTAHRPGTDAVVAFSGNLELLACLERLAATGEDPDRQSPEPHPLTEPTTAPPHAVTTKGR